VSNRSINQAPATTHEPAEAVCLEAAIRQSSVTKSNTNLNSESAHTLQESIGRISFETATPYFILNPVTVMEGLSLVSAVHFFFFLRVRHEP